MALIINNKGLQIYADKTPSFSELNKSLITDLSHQPNYEEKDYLVYFSKLREPNNIEPLKFEGKIIIKIWVKITDLSRSSASGQIKLLQFKGNSKLMKPPKNFPKFIDMLQPDFSAILFLHPNIYDITGYPLGCGKNH